MTEAGIASIIAAAGSAIAAVLSGLSLLISARNSRKIELVHKATNGMSVRLNQITGEAEHAKGVIQGEKNTSEGRYADGVKWGRDHPRQRE